MVTENLDQPVIDISSLPDLSMAEVDFHDTSFFQSGRSSSPHLPTPSEVLQRHPGLYNGVVRFDHLNLIVKVGQDDYYRLEEAQTMRALKRAFPDGEVPVPEVFGWRKSDGRIFIYMSLIRGRTLREEWPSLTPEEKKSVCDELRQIVLALRRITQGSPDRFIGKSDA
jgi:aminoglycoside phosphotransferase (APT) family kinase protein